MATLAERFWSKVDRSGSCWPWLASKTKGGYGRFRADGKVVLSHRLAYELTYGPIPPGVKILHMCDYPPCCNPEHLRAGTQLENVQDMWQKDRQGDRSHLLLYCGKVKLNGERNPAAVLSDTQVVAIRACYDAGIPQRVIAELFGVSQSHVSELVRKEQWKHVA